MVMVILHCLIFNHLSFEALLFLLFALNVLVHAKVDVNFYSQFESALFSTVSIINGLVL